MTRASTAPGPIGIKYRVYKNFPKLRKWLKQLLRVTWNKGHMVDSLMSVEGCFIPKEQNWKILRSEEFIS